MTTLIATLVCLAGILGLFWLDRDSKGKTSIMLWLPSIWFFLACSRSIARWFNIGTTSVNDQMMEGSPIDKAVLGAFVVAGLVILYQRWAKVSSILRQCLPIILYFGYCLASLLWSDFPDVGFRRWTKAIGDWVMILIVFTDPQPSLALRRLLTRVGYTAIPLSVLYAKYYPMLGRAYGRWSGAISYIGITTDKNTLGALCMLLGLASVWQLYQLFGKEAPRRHRAGKVVVHVAILAMVFWLFAVLDSMTSLSCFVLTSGLVLSLQLKIYRRIPFLVHAVIVGMVGLTAAIAFLGLSPAALHAMGRNSSLTERTDIWAEVIKLVPNVWLGTGYESFWLGKRLDDMITNVTRWWVPNQSHNGYLEIWANLGWVGIVLLACVLVWGYGRVIQQWRRKTEGSDLMLAYFVGGVIFNFTEAAFFRMMAPVWIFLLLALTSPAASLTRIGKNMAEAKTAKPKDCEITEVGVLEGAVSIQV